MEKLFARSKEAVMAKLDESNIVNIGGKEDRIARRKAANSEKQFAKAGQKVGLEIWRVHNIRTENDTPLFGIESVPKEEYGTFYSGDSYLVMNTYHPLNEDGEEADRFAFDIHFFLGKDTTQDEAGVAAYKAVELDNKLDDVPIQYRELQGAESKLFRSYFKELIYQEGGYPSGFRKVHVKDYKPRLYMIRSSSKVTRAFEVPVEVTSVNDGDSFVLDLGETVYVFNGETSNAQERNRAGLLQSNIVNSRNGKSKKGMVDESFWNALGGTAEDIRGADDPYLPSYIHDDKPFDRKVKLLRVSDTLGYVRYSKVAEGSGFEYKQLDPTDVFLVHTNIQLFVWIGSECSKAEKSQSMRQAVKYLADNKLDENTPITCLTEKNAKDNHLFASLFRY